MPSIVTLVVTQQVAPTPSTLQRTGAFISQGATITAPNTLSLLTQLSDLTPILRGALALSTLTWSGSVVTATAASPHGFTIGDMLYLSIVGCSPSGYNGVFFCTITSSTQFTYALTSNPGSIVTSGSYTPEDVSELVAMATTFFAQGASVAVYVLELGAGNASDGVTVLTNFLSTNPSKIYSFLVPRYWDAASSFLALIATYEALTAKTYFFVTTNLENYAVYTSLMKDVVALIEAPFLGVYPQNTLTGSTWSGNVATFTTTSAHGVSAGEWFQITGCVPIGYNGWYQALNGTTGSTLLGSLIVNPGSISVEGTLVASQIAQAAIPATEFTLAAAFWVSLHYNPSSTNKVTPFAFSYLFGVTPFPTQGLNATLTTLQNASINYVLTGAEGGITNTILWQGTTMDARDFTYWYSVDWAQINSDLNISNAVINGSNNPQNPLYYEQNGINRLQNVAAATMNSAVSVGLATGQIIKTQWDAQTFAENIESGNYNGMLVVNAVPFIPYLTVNPGDYKIEKYGGLSVQYIPARGFKSIVFGINVTDFVAGAP